jgi:hypothetical protein
MIVRSILQFQEANPKAVKQEPKSDADTFKRVAPSA